MLPAAGLRVGRGSRTFPPSPDRHLPARSFPRGLQPQLSAFFSPGKGFLARGARGQCASLRCGAESIPKAGYGAGPAWRQLCGGAALPLLPERAPPLAPPAREPGRGGRGQEAASAPGSAAAGVGGQQPRSRPRERPRPERAAETKTTVSASPAGVALQASHLALGAPWAGTRSP